HPHDSTLSPYTTLFRSQADRAGRIVRNLLTFARKGPAEQAPVDLNDVIQRTLLLMSYDLTLMSSKVRWITSFRSTGACSAGPLRDRKSTRLNSSHLVIS